MAVSIKFKVEGLKELSAAMLALGDKMVNKISGDATYQAAKLVQKKAKAIAPESEKPVQWRGKTVQPGNLKRSITIRKAKKGETQHSSEHFVGVRGDAGYARYLEFGTVKMAARSFLRPAIDIEKEWAIKAMEAAIKDGLDKETK